MSRTTELDWFKSSYSSARGDGCVEVADTEQAVHVRDSEDVSRQVLAVGREGWNRFVRHLAGERRGTRPGGRSSNATGEPAAPGCA